MSWRANRVLKALKFDTDQYNEWVAIHEAGHAISSLTLGHRLRYAEVRFDRDGIAQNGIVMAANRARARDLAALPVFHAGLEAQEIWLQQSSLWTPYRMDVSAASSRHDYEVIGRFTPDRDQQRRDADQARTHITHQWRRVNRLANALLEHGRLNARDLRRI